jgi:hypothetical protein
LLRQTLAVLILWNIFIQFKTNRFVIYLGIFFASFFHISSFVFIIMYEFYRFFLKFEISKVFLISVGISFFFFIFFPFFIEYFSPYLLYFFGDRFLQYIDFSGSINLINSLLKLFFYTLFLFNYKSLQFEFKKLFFLLCSVTIIFSSINIQIFDRLTEVGMFSFYLIIPILILNLKDYKNIIHFAFFALFFIILVRFLITFDSGHFLSFDFS